MSKTVRVPRDEFDGVTELSVDEVGSMALDEVAPAPADGRYRVVNGMLHGGDGAMLGQVSDVREDGDTVTVTLGIPLPGDPPAPP